VEREEDVMAVSVLADDLQGVLLEYQVSSDPEKLI